MTPSDAAAAVAETLLEAATTAIARRGRFSIAVPGGSVAEIAFPLFANLPVDWSRVDLTWVDERVVPSGDADSNVHAATVHWLARLTSAGPRILAPTMLGSANETAAAWQRTLVDALGQPPQIDVAMLGVGPDGHVASLFPGHPLLERQDIWVAGLDDAPKPPPSRVTLTLPTLRAAGEIWVVAFGREKAAALRAAREDPASRLPLALVVAGHPHVRWYLDDDARGA
jgi:6-phosphogluconolactonase